MQENFQSSEKWFKENKIYDCHEYIVEYLDSSSGELIFSNKWRGVNRIESVIDHRRLSVSAFYCFNEFRLNGLRSHYLPNTIQNAEGINVAVKFRYSILGKFETIELTQTIQTASEQLLALSTEYEFFRKIYPSFKGVMLKECQCANESGLFVVSNSFLNENHLVKPIEYQVQIEIISHSNHKMFSVSKIFNFDSSYLNRSSSMAFIGGVYAALNIMVNGDEIEPGNDTEINFRGQKCFLFRKLIIKQAIDKEESTSILFENKFNSREEILWKLHQEANWFKIRKIKVEYNAVKVDNDTFHWGVGNTGMPFPNDRSEGLVWTKNDPSIYYVISPYEQLLTGILP